MNKQQAFEKATNERGISNGTEAQNLNGYKNGFSDAWEAPKSQCENDAKHQKDPLAQASRIAGILKEAYEAHNPGKHFDYAGFSLHCISKLTPLFNPSGSAPQTEGPVGVDKSRRQWMRKEAITIFELTKGYTPEQRALFDNAMKGMEDMAGHVLELTNEPESAPQVFTREQVERLEKENESLRECIQGLRSNLAAYRRHEDTKDDIRDWNT